MRCSTPLSPEAALRLPRGFSLIETITVLVLISLFTTVATTSLRGTRGVLMDRLLLEQLAQFDQRVRSRAWQTKAPREVTIDFSQRTVQEQPLNADPTTPLVWSHRPDRPRIEAIWTRATGWVEVGTVAWRYGPEGSAATFVIELSRPGPTAKTRENRQFIVAGASGQWTDLTKEGGRDAEIFRILRDPARP
ncbi:MAG: prepilin-type N-terminal cleavage/methylation domain-containing protein [Planctomycetota bacterium]